MALDNDDLEIAEILERELSPEEFLAKQKSSIRKNSWRAIIVGAFLTVFSIGAIR